MANVESAIAKLKSSEKSLRMDALIALARHGNSAAAVLPDLLRYGGHVTDRQELAILVQVMAKIGDNRALPFLTAILENNLDAKIGRYAADCLGQIGDPAALPSLLVARHSPNHLVRAAARAAAKRIIDCPPSAGH